MKTLSFRALSVLSVVLAVLTDPGLRTSAQPNLELCVSPHYSFVLYRPPTRQVSTQGYLNGRMVAIAAPKGPGFARMLFRKTSDSSRYSVKFASREVLEGVCGKDP